MLFQFVIGKMTKREKRSLIRGLLSYINVFTTNILKWQKIKMKMSLRYLMIGGMENLFTMKNIVSILKRRY